jgi:hypothetical protein
MRVALDPVPLVLGIYSYVGELLARTAERREDDEPAALGRRFGRQRAEAADREVQRLVRTLHADIKTADKLFKKTGDVWKISRESDLVDLVVQAKAGEEEKPAAYVLLRPEQIRALLIAIRDAARGTGEDEETIAQLDQIGDALEARPSEYLAFGFDPWGAA